MVLSEFILVIALLTLTFKSIVYLKLFLNKLSIQASALTIECGQQQGSKQAQQAHPQILSNLLVIQRRAVSLVSLPMPGMSLRIETQTETRLHCRDKKRKCSAEGWRFKAAKAGNRVAVAEVPQGLWGRKHCQFDCL